MTGDVLGWLLANCSSNRLVAPETVRFCCSSFRASGGAAKWNGSPSIDAETVRRAAELQRADIATSTCLAIQLGRLRPVS
jgi:hypothetical protein